ncbi:hypothetical protein SEA_TRIUMPH_42 [Streptomyces phage Triumph]|nr:hypothetical protein SEA_TRIUMPH_42 [Streptomyces phage Triumph]
MAAIETIETETVESTEKPASRRRAPRSNKTMTTLAVLDDALQRAMREVVPQTFAATPDHRRRHHDGRATAWARQYAHEGTYDSLLLSHAFESLSCYPHEQRHALVQLAAVALGRVQQLDEAGK